MAYGHKVVIGNDSVNIQYKQRNCRRRAGTCSLNRRLLSYFLRGETTSWEISPKGKLCHTQRAGRARSTWECEAEWRRQLQGV